MQDSTSLISLTPEDKAALTGDSHHPDHCDCSPYASEQGFGVDVICDDLAELFTQVQRLLHARVIDAWYEGYGACDEDARGVNKAWPDTTKNPYRGQA